jgi:nucleotide-binding universal stress UspA family protein
MIKTILVSVMGGESDAAGYRAAAAIAGSFGAHVDALYVRLDAVRLAVSMSTEGAGGTLLEGIVSQFEQEAAQGEAKARADFAAFCAREALPSTGGDDGPSAAFHVETGDPARWTTTYALTADLIIAHRDAPGREAAARTMIEALLLETGRPLLVPGVAAPAPNFADRVTIAWKPTAETARAVAAALPFLTRAKDVVIMRVTEDEADAGDTGRLVRYLARHGIKAAEQRLSPAAEGAAATLLAAANARGGLLVMGGYGHTRLREWVFGGFTQLALDAAAIPVLMTH